MKDKAKGGMLIFLADADENSRSSISSMLISAGHRVQAAISAQEAKEQLEKILPDVVLIDQALINSDDEMATALMSRQLVSQFVPVVLLTMDNSDEVIENCVSLDVDDFLAKPVSFSALNFKLQSFQRMLGRHQILDEYQRHTEDELATSEQIINSLVENGGQRIPELASWTEAMGHFSGDSWFYKVFDNGRIYVLLCDFTGHGLPAAIGTVFVADLFRSMTNKSFEAVDILNEINGKMNQILPTGRYCAAIMLDFDPSLMKLKVWNCGLPSALLTDDTHKVIKNIPSACVPLGVLSGDAKCEVIEVEVQQGESIIMFSDGITEAENANGEMYSDQRLLACIENTKKDAEICKEIQNNVEDFMGGTHPTDDISLVVLNFNSN